MVREVVDLLVPARSTGGWYLDATVGAGGHTRALCESAGPTARVVALDQDAEALVAAAGTLQELATQVIFRHGNFGQLGVVLDELGLGPLDGALLDLGVSSTQLDAPRRGFSFQAEGPLDMRMNSEQTLSAVVLVNQWSEAELADLITQYGQERWARRIARAIVQARPIATTTALAACIVRALPRGRAWQRIHPATRTFQALRLAVNRELETLETALPQLLSRLRPGGRIVVLAYHSLEDRIVKQTFRQAAAAGTLTILTRKPLRPTEAEVQANPRARSARLRAAERTR